MNDNIMPNYECHITIEPVFGEKLEMLKRMAKVFGFKVADLLMQKRPDDTPERSKHDTFCTGWGSDYIKLKYSMLDFINALEVWEYTVWRYKIEKIILDSKYCDADRPLKKGITK